LAKLPSKDEGFIALNVYHAAQLMEKGYIAVRPLHSPCRQCGVIKLSEVDGINYSLWENPSSQLNKKQLKDFENWKAFLANEYNPLNVP
jgi:hypothetical protein